MGKRGPKPKPLEERILEGNPSKRPLRPDADEEDLSFGGLRMPTRLTEEERGVWRDTISAFPEWYFTQADKHLLIAYCRVVVRLDKSEKALQKTSAVTKRANGSPCVNPHIGIINSAMAQVVALSERLGLTRATRRNVGPPPVQPPLGPATPDSPVGVEPEDIPDDLIAPGI